MFVHALQIGQRFTAPYVGLRRTHDGTVRSAVAAFTLLNADGWVLTSAHIVDGIERAETSRLEAVKLESQLAELDSRQDIDHAERTAERRRLHQLLAEMVSHHAEVWAVPGFAETRPRAAEHAVDVAADIAAVRLEPLSPPLAALPILRPASDPIAPGMSICRIGYPFHSVTADFDDANKSFRITSGFPVPAFALDGIVSRFESVTVEHEDRRVSFIETSTPGLRGQSGAPVLDVEGRVIGLQSRTVHLDLGFDATYEKDCRIVVERQFLNSGVATHVEQVRAFLEERGIEYRRQ